MVIIIMLSVSIGVGWLDYYCLNFVVLNPVFLSCYQCQLVIKLSAVVTCNRDPKPSCTASLQHKRHT